ncbi:MAG: LPS export ABC transporter permease LptF, partial [Rhodospirillaceae bacterium]|nr:LPS export ABC transporter permease LptF [Rhodospirillaceae bacterium]
MNLLDRYILRETFAAWFVVTLVLFVILMSNQFAEILDDAASNQLPRDAVFAVLRLTSLQYLTFLTPIGLFLGVMLALARFNRDSEMAAMASCGVGPLRLLGPISVLTAGLAISVAWLSLISTPDAARQIEAIRAEAREALEIGVLESGVFTSPDAGATTIYAQDVDGETIYDVFIEHQDGDRVIVIRAERGERRHDAADGHLTFVLYNGRRYEGVPGENRFRIVETKPLQALLASAAPVDRAELQWRLSAPVSLFVLALVAVPLSRSRPREGRYARLGVGILVYIIYANMLSIA